MVEVHPPNVENWGKVANYPPNAQQRSALLRRRRGDFASPLDPRFFEGLELANIGCGTSIHFENINYLLYFAILLDDNAVQSLCMI